MVQGRQLRRPPDTTSPPRQGRARPPGARERGDVPLSGRWVMSGLPSDRQFPAGAGMNQTRF